MRDNLDIKKQTAGISSELQNEFIEKCAETKEKKQALFSLWETLLDMDKVLEQISRDILDKASAADGDMEKRISERFKAKFTYYSAGVGTAGLITTMYFAIQRLYRP